MSAEKVYKRFVSFVSQSLNTCLSVLKVIVQSKYRLNIPAANGNKCIVLANGPSLKSSLEKHPAFFKQHPLICVNTFAVTEEFVLLKPTYYVMLDPFFWERKSDVTGKTFENLEKNTNWPLYLMVPRHALKQKVFVELQKKNPNIHLTPFNYTVFKGFPSVAHWLYNKNLAMPQSLNVTIAALFLGVNLGFKEIYLVGADHTWHENLHMTEENILHTKVTHFYENDTEIKLVPFLKSGDPKKGTQKAHEFFDIWSRTFYAYILVNNYAVYHHCKIYNASEVSFIDAFKRIKL
ncbi:MAG: 6-hydroxymethylpterin diphosphokinase MptE-like protein [Bacteroidota bacterium]